MTEYKITTYKNKNASTATSTKDFSGEHNPFLNSPRPRAAVKKSGTHFAVRLQKNADDTLFNKNSSRLKPLIRRIENLSVSTKVESQIKNKTEDNPTTHTVSKEEQKEKPKTAKKIKALTDEEIKRIYKKNEKVNSIMIKIGA